jgi:hypothetical protein
MPAGCYDPGTGLGQYTSLSACQANCSNVTDSFACMVGTAPGITTCVGPGVYTMGQANVMAVYSTMAACIADSCNVIPPSASWDCGLAGCYDPGTGLGQYSTLSSCQAVCTSSFSLLCDSMTATGSQSQITMQVNNLNTIIDYWITTAPDGTVLGQDSMWNMHNVFNSNPSGIPYDSIITCITYADASSWYTCCVTWIWDPASGTWTRMGGATSIDEINYERKVVKVLDVLGRETNNRNHQLLFYIYDDGRIEKKYIK